MCRGQRLLHGAGAGGGPGERWRGATRSGGCVFFSGWGPRTRCRPRCSTACDAPGVAGRPTAAAISPVSSASRCGPRRTTPAASPLPSTRQESASASVLPATFFAGMDRAAASYALWWVARVVPYLPRGRCSGFAASPSRSCRWSRHWARSSGCCPWRPSTGTGACWGRWKCGRAVRGSTSPPCRPSWPRAGCCRGSRRRGRCVAGLPAVVGLWAVLVSLLVYAVFGSSRQLSVGPESTTALLTATVVAPMAAGDPARYAALAAALALVVGALCLLAWLFRLGFVADLLSKPVLVGYMAGVGVLMIAGQLGKTTGVPVEGDTVVSQLESFLRGLGEMHGPTVLLSSAVLVLLFVGAHRFPRAPVPLDRHGARPRWPPTVLDLQDGRHPGGRRRGHRAAAAAAFPTVGRPISSRCCCPPSASRVVGVHRQRPDRAGLRRSATATASTPTRNCSRSARPTSATGFAAGVPGQQQRQPDGDRRGARQPQPALLARRGRGRGRDAARSLARCSRASPSPRSARIVIWAATRLIDVRGVPADRPLPAQRARPGAGHHRGRPRRRHPVRRAHRGRAVDPRPAAPGGPPARRHPRLRARGSPACTTSTTTRTPARCPGWWSTATTPRCSSPTPRTSRRRALASIDLAGGRYRVVHPQRRGQRRGRRDLRRTPWRSCGRSSAGAASSSAWRGSSRTSATSSPPPGCVDRIGEDRIFPTLPTAVAAYVAAYTARHGAPPEGWQSLAPGQPSPG